jgi:hypothetical protein
MPAATSDHRVPLRRSGAALSPAERRVLWRMGAHGPITGAALAGRLEVDPGDLSAVLDALGRRGYVQPDRYGVPDLTGAGRHALVKLIRAGHARQPTRAAPAAMPGRVGPARRPGLVPA